MPDINTEDLLKNAPSIPKKSDVPWPDGVPVKETFPGSKVARHPKSGCLLSLKRAQELGGKLPELPKVPEIPPSTVPAVDTALPQSTVNPSQIKADFKFEPAPERPISQDRPLPDFSDLPGGTKPPESIIKPSTVAPPALSTDYRRNAELTFDTVTSLAQGFIGPEWAPHDLALNGKVVRTAMDERESVVAPLAKLYELKQMPDIPPGWALAIAVVTYAAPRFKVPNTREKAFGLWMRAKNLFGKFRKGRPKISVVEGGEK